MRNLTLRRNLFVALLLGAITVPVAYGQDYDDIYYNPNNGSGKSQSAKKESNYIKDFSSIDVDDYNRRGFYYTSPVDTIGLAAESGEDFVVTQQIQKYYNPTIVLDNATILEDVLDNSYGNVDIIVNNYGVPQFTSAIYYPYSNRYYYNGWGNWTCLPSWNWSFAPSYGLGWGLTWTWFYGPEWGFGPGWGYGPGWGWGGWFPPGRPYYADYRPGSHRPVGPAPGWSNTTRPNGVINGRPGSLGRPGSSNSRPGYAGSSSSRPVSGPTPVGNRRDYSQNQAQMKPIGNSTQNGTARPVVTNNRVTSSSSVAQTPVRGTVSSGAQQKNTSKVATDRSSSVRNSSTQSNRSNSSNSSYRNSSNNSNSGSGTMRNSGSSTMRNSGSTMRSSGSTMRSSGSSSRSSSGSMRSSGGSRGGNRR
ncbi:MAG: hypothetical protein HDS24_02410 [Bacteroides sp.]|nr:hypothetical protein [Bacteroides sp.]